MSSSNESLRTLIARIRRGDADAATELVRRHERAVRVEVRLRLRDPQLRRVLDSTDICQSVLAGFLLRTANGHYAQLEDPRELVKLLITMARNKVVDQARRHHAMCRDVRQTQPLTATEHEQALCDPCLPPDEEVALQEDVTQVFDRLAPLDRQIARCRADGMRWHDIGAELGSPPETLRRRFSRTVSRLSAE